CRQLRSFRGVNPLHQKWGLSADPMGLGSPGSRLYRRPLLRGELDFPPPVYRPLSEGRGARFLIRCFRSPWNGTRESLTVRRRQPRHSRIPFLCGTSVSETQVAASRWEVAGRPSLLPPSLGQLIL